MDHGLKSGRIIAMADVTIGQSGGSRERRMVTAAGSGAKKIETKKKIIKGENGSGEVNKMIVKAIQVIRNILLPAGDIERRVNITRRILEKCDRLNDDQ